MSKKRASAAKKEPEETKVDIEGVFGVAEPPPEEEEEPSGVQEPEETPAPEETPEEVEELPAAAEAEVPEPVTEPETAPTEDELRQKIIEEREQHEKGLVQEIQRLRAEMKVKEVERQAPMPLQQQAPPPAPPPAEEPAFNFDFEVGDDGKLRPTRESMQAYHHYNQSMIDQRVAAATQVDPRVEMERLVDSETQKWVQGDPQRFQAAQRVREASENMEVMINHHTMTTGQNPAGVTEWLQAMEYNGTGQTFQQAYPEITDMYTFVETFFAPTSLPHRIEKIRRYMDGHMAGQTPAETSMGGQTPESSNVVPLSPDRPRSMAQKGRGMEQGTTEQREFENLEREASGDPICLEPGARERLERMNYLARKLRIDTA